MAQKEFSVVAQSGRGGGWYSDIFLGGGQKNEYFLGYEDFVDIFGGSSQT